MVQNTNPWNEIRLDDYINHMGSMNVFQLQMLNQIMKEQLESSNEEIRKKSTVAILGVTSGNGLEHIAPLKIGKVIGIDINEEYLDICKKQYAFLEDCLELYCMDLTIDKTKARDVLDKTDLIIADLIIEHIHLDNFVDIIKQLSQKNRILSCVIQNNTDGTLVSQSGYEHAFDCLIPTIEEQNEKDITTRLINIGYNVLLRKVYVLPNGKCFIRLDYTFKC